MSTVISPPRQRRQSHRPLATSAAAALALIVAGALVTTYSAAPLSVSAKDRSLQPGEVVVLTVTSTSPIASLRARAFDHSLTPYLVDTTTWCVIVGIDLDVTPRTYVVSIDADTAGGPAHADFPLAVTTKGFPTRTLTVDDAFVNPPASVTSRIAAEAVELARLWDHPTPTRLWNGAFVAPVPDPANSAFGSRSVFNGQARSPHAGADFLSPEGRPVHAPNGGRVVLAKPLYYTGNTIVIDHGLGLFSLFAHLSVSSVQLGDVVTTGEAIGRVGSTGRVTGPHLHWAVRANGARVDPLSILEVLGPAGGPAGGTPGSR